MLDKKLLSKEIDPLDLLEGDRDAIILFLRASGYGNEYPITATDEKTGKEFDTTIDLSGYVKDEDTWKLWIGKIGAVNYDDDPYCDFETNKFAEAIVAALDKVEEFIKDVEDEPENWIQYYKDI
jgi:hypothetical protein